MCANNRNKTERGLRQRKSRCHGRRAGGRAEGHDTVADFLQKRATEVYDKNEVLAEYDAHLVWLRMCRAPSRRNADKGGPTYVTGTVAVSVDQRTLDKVNKQLEGVERTSGVSMPRLTKQHFEEAVKNVNHPGGMWQLAAPPFQTLNADGRAPYEAAYVTWLRAFQKDDPFTGKPLGDETTHVAHVVPKAYLKSTTGILEFEGAVNDPVNVVIAKKRDNERWGTASLYLGRAFAMPGVRDGTLWSPSGFARVQAAAMARAVAFMALTYPFINDNQGSIVGGRRQQRSTVVRVPGQRRDTTSCRGTYRGTHDPRARRLRLLRVDKPTGGIGTNPQ